LFNPLSVAPAPAAALIFSIKRGRWIPQATAIFGIEAMITHVAQRQKNAKNKKIACIYALFTG
jgi:hypothetical protein